jgi:hypothetical protein
MLVPDKVKNDVKAAEEAKKAAAEAKAAEDKSAEDKKSDILTKEEVQALLDKQKEDFDKTLKEAVKEAASKEKEKLYDTVEKYKKDLEVLAVSAKKEQEEKDKLLKAEEDKKKEEMSAKDRVTQLEVEMTKTTKRFEEAISLKDVEFKGELAKRDLEIFKEKLIAEAKGEIISEMVKGTSEEELKQSAEQSKVRYKEIVENQKKQLTDELVRLGKIPGPDGKDKQDQTPGVSGDERSVADIFTMPEEEFSAYKDEVLKKYSG